MMIHNVAKLKNSAGLCGKTKEPPQVEALRGFSGSDGHRSRDLSIFSRTLYQLSYRAQSE